jgi:hypothetical protein
MLLAEMARLPEGYEFSDRERESLVNLARAIRRKVGTAGAGGKLAPAQGGRAGTPAPPTSAGAAGIPKKPKTGNRNSKTGN